MKKENGAIAVYVSVACLFIVIIGVAAFIQLNNKQSSQMQQLQQVEAAYNTQTSMEQEYQTYSGGEIVPIYTGEQLLKIGSNEEIYIDGKIYKLSINSTYVLGNDIEISSSFTDIANRIKNNNILIQGNGYKIIETNSLGEKLYYTEDTNYETAQTNVNE